MSRKRPTGAVRLLMLALGATVMAAALGVTLAGCGTSARLAEPPAARGSGVTTRTGTVISRPAADTVTSPTVTRTTAFSPAGVPSVRVGAPLAVRPVAPGFLGISTEYYAIEWYGGSDPSDLDTPFLNLVANLAPGASPVLRIGGDSTDWLWLNTPGVTKVKALKVTITDRTVRVLAAITRRLNAKLLLGINLEDDNLRLAENIARTLVSAVGRSRVMALEIGNEPELYDVLGWYADAQGQPVYGRPKGYSPADYTAEFNRYGAHVLPGEPFAGPAGGSVNWGGNLASFDREAHRLAVVTLHDYPLKRCGTRPGLSTYPTISKLLSASSTRGLAQQLVPRERAAHAAGKQVRVDELNSVACFGLKGVSDTYASALWSLETAEQFARLGFDGLNISTVPSAVYRLFVTSHAGGTWSAAVSPDYYGLLDFADAVPAGSRVLATPDSGANPQVFAVRTPLGATHVIIVNRGAARRLGLRIAGSGGAEASATYLRGPALAATSGVTLGGQSFGPATSTGTLSGTATAVAVTPVAGVYVVPLPAHTAVTLSVGGNPPRDTELVAPSG